MKRSNVQNRKELTATQLIDDSPRGEALVTWKNVSTDRVKLEIYVGPGREVSRTVNADPDFTTPIERTVETPRWLVDWIEPGGEVQLPASIPIHQVRNGVIVGSHAPQLRRVDDLEPTFAPGVFTPSRGSTVAAAMAAVKANKYAEPIG